MCEAYPLHGPGPDRTYITKHIVYMYIHASFIRHRAAAGTQQSVPSVGTCLPVCLSASSLLKEHTPHFRELPDPPEVLCMVFCQSFVVTILTTPKIVSNNPQT